MIGIVIILLLVLFLELSGFLILKKINLKTRYSIIFGFLLLIVFFEFISLPFIVFQTTFTLYRRATWLILIFLYLFLFLKLETSKCDIREWLATFDKTKIIVYVVAIISGIYVGIVSYNGTDSWLYMPMVLNPLQNNEMVYSMGHIFDGYYKFLSFLTYYTGNSLEANYIFLMVFYKFFETLIIVMFFGFIAEQIFSKTEKFVLLLLSIGFLWQIIYLLPSYADFEATMFIDKSSPCGTLFLEILIIPLLFIYLYKGYKSNILLFIILISGLGFSSSMIYVYPMFLVVYVAQEIFINKNFYKRDYLIKLSMITIPLYVLGEYFIVSKTGVGSGDSLIKYSFLNLSIYTSVFFLMLLIAKKTDKEVRIKKFYLFSFGLYIYAIIFIAVIMEYLSPFPFILDRLGNMFDIVNLSTSKYSGNTGFDYNTYLNYGIYSFMYVIGLIVTYKKDKKLVYLHIIVVVLLANYLVYETVGRVISQMVYHRVYILASCYIFVIIGFIFIWKKLFEKEYKINNIVINKRKYVYIIIVFLLFINFNLNNLYKFDKSFIEYKQDGPDAMEFTAFNFPKSQYVQLPKEIGRGPAGQIIQFNTDLIETDVCEMDCYVVQNRNEYLGDASALEFETANYVVTYVE